jgi:DNA-binding PadR family transcriptional regulator
MTKREFLRQEVLKFVQHDLAQYGYKLNKRQTEFTKKIKQDG